MGALHHQRRGKTHDIAGHAAQQETLIAAAVDDRWGGLGQRQPLQQALPPHPLTLLIGCIIAAAALTYILPAGQYDRVDDPETLRLDRRFPRDHMSFGRGAHFCVGAGLARLETRVVCEELLRGTERLALADGDPPAYTPSVFVRRLARLPLVL